MNWFAGGIRRFLDMDGVLHLYLGISVGVGNYRNYARLFISAGGTAAFFAAWICAARLLNYRPLTKGMSMDVAYIAAGIAVRVGVIVIDVQSFTPDGAGFIWTTGIYAFIPVFSLINAVIAEPVDSFVCSLTVRNPYSPFIA